MLTPGKSTISDYVLINTIDKLRFILSVLISFRRKDEDNTAIEFYKY